MSDIDSAQPKLTAREAAFIDFYVGVAYGNASEAARLAGYKDPGQAGWENKQKQEIRDAIDKRLAERTLTANQVLDLLTQQATANLEDFIEVYAGGAWGWSFEKAQKAGKLHLLNGLEQGRQGMKLLLCDKQNALIQIGRYHKLFTDKTENVDPDIDAKIEAELRKRGMANVETGGEGAVPRKTPSGE